MNSEIWFEPTHLHFHTGHEAQIKLYQGRQMIPHARGEEKDVFVKLINPNGSSKSLTAAAVNEDYLMISFNPVSEDLYTLTAQASGGRFAKLIVPVGHDLHGGAKALGEELEIVPEIAKEYRLNDRIMLTVLNNNKPLAGVKVQATYHLFDGEEYPYTLSTNEEGKVEFTFSEKGHWMFKVGNDGKTATFVVPGVR